MSRTGLWDSHAHLDSDYFTDDRDELIAKIGEEMEGFINPGCDEASSAFAVQLAEKYDFVYAAVGWHPEELAGIKDEHYLDKLAAWAVHPKVAAIGEIGLDYYWKENEPKEVQKKRLLEQIDIAVQFVEHLVGIVDRRDRLVRPRVHHPCPGIRPLRNHRTEFERAEPSARGGVFLEEVADFLID